jgi:hypothetical protein
MNKNHKDGFQRDRLFLNKLEEAGLTVVDFGFFRENVIWIKTIEGKFVLKGFRRKITCKKQLLLSKLYEGQSPRVMGTYTRFPQKKRYISYGNYIWALMPFYKGDGLHFGALEDVSAGMRAISRFHSASSRVPSEIYNDLPSYSLFEKWEDRFAIFKENARTAKWSEPIKPLLSDILFWGEWSLKHFDHSAVSTLVTNAKKKREITHGDVAPHNFVKNKEGSAYLIDFDLFAAVPQAYDWLQYANRILPFWRWSYSVMEETEHDDFLKWFHKKWFVIALVFPTDLYREWNRALKSKDPVMLEQITNFTLRDFPYRKKFVNRIIRKLEKPF